VESTAWVELPHELIDDRFDCKFLFVMNGHLLHGAGQRIYYVRFRYRNASSPLKQKA